ncbi:MAG: hypothetical protein K2I63_04110, partial [Helicobacter sp.]|nr:hypothetical protein [Helicobacter sp.]
MIDNHQLVLQNVRFRLFNLQEKKNPTSKIIDSTNSTKIPSNPHLGSGLVGGSIAGFENNKEGNLTFNPENFLLGLVGGSIGSKGVSEGFKVIKDNPSFKEKLQEELANVLSKGWESAVRQYPILQSLEPRYIVKNEKGRAIQAKGVLKEVEEKADFDKIAANDSKNLSLFFKELSNGDKFFKDEKGKVHKLSQEMQKQWMDTFNLKSLEESYTPKHNETIKEALGEKEIKLTQGSLLKLATKNRLQYIPQIKETLENPDVVLRDKAGGIIFAKNIDDKLYFTSVGVDFDTHITIISNAPKTAKNLLNKKGEIIYQSPNFGLLPYNKLLQDDGSTANKIDGKIIPQIQEPRYIVKNEKGRAMQV